MAKYKLTNTGVQNTETGAFIPAAAGNRDWGEYQQWLSEGNTPDPQYTPSQLKANKKQEINQERDRRINGGQITFGGNEFDTDSRGRENLSGVVAHVAAGGSLPGGFTWRTTDNQDIPMDSTDIVNLGATMVDYVNNIYITSWDLKAQVDALSEGSPGLEDELDAIQWP